jgi:Sulfatase
MDGRKAARPRTQRRPRMRPGAESFKPSQPTAIVAARHQSQYRGGAVADAKPFARASLRQRYGWRVPKAPHIVVLMTDQEQRHMHWPSGWAERNLPALQRLKRHGLYFNRAYTAATQCSPSRALMMTGRFAPINRLESASGRDQIVAWTTSACIRA